MAGPGILVGSNIGSGKGGGGETFTTVYAAVGDTSKPYGFRQYSNPESAATTAVPTTWYENQSLGLVTTMVGGQPKLTSSYENVFFVLSWQPSYNTAPTMFDSANVTYIQAWAQSCQAYFNGVRYVSGNVNDVNATNPWPLFVSFWFEGDGQFSNPGQCLNVHAYTFPIFKLACCNWLAANQPLGTTSATYATAGTIHVSGLAANVPAGEISIVNAAGTHYQTFITAGALAGATTITVTATPGGTTTPNFAYPSGSTIVSQTCPYGQIFADDRATNGPASGCAAFPSNTSGLTTPSNASPAGAAIPQLTTYLDFYTVDGYNQNGNSATRSPSTVYGDGVKLDGQGTANDGGNWWPMKTSPLGGAGANVGVTENNISVGSNTASVSPSGTPCSAPVGTYANLVTWFDALWGMMQTYYYGGTDPDGNVVPAYTGVIPGLWFHWWAGVYSVAVADGHTPDNKSWDQPSSISPGFTSAVLPALTTIVDASWAGQTPPTSLFDEDILGFIGTGAGSSGPTSGGGSGLAAYWALEGATTTDPDESGNSHTLSITNAVALQQPTVIPSDSLTCVLFGAMAGTYTVAQTSPAWSPSFGQTGVSIGAAIRWPGTPSAVQHILQNLSGNTGAQLATDSAGHITCTFGNGSTTQTCNSGIIPTEGDDVLIGAVWDNTGDVTTDNLNLFVFDLTSNFYWSATKTLAPAVFTPSASNWFISSTANPLEAYAGRFWVIPTVLTFADLYGLASDAGFNPSPTQYDTAVLAYNPSIYWAMEDSSNGGTSQVAADLTGNTEGLACTSVTFGETGILLTDTQPCGGFTSASSASSIPGDAGANLSLGDGVTVSAFIQWPTATIANQTILANLAGTNGVLLSTNASGYLTVQFGDGSALSTPLVSSIIPTPGDSIAIYACWHNAGTGQINLYTFDITTSTQSAFVENYSTGTFTTPTNWTVGPMVANAGRFFVLPQTINLTQAETLANAAGFGQQIYRTAGENCLTADAAHASGLSLHITEPCVSVDTASGHLSQQSRTATESVATVDTAPQASTFARTATESCATVDTAPHVTAYPRTASESCAAVDTAAGNTGWIAGAAEACVTADVAVRSAQSLARTAAESCASVDSASRQVVINRVGYNRLTAVDSSFEAGIGSYTDDINCALSTSTAQALDGTHSLALTSIVAGEVVALTGRYPATAGVTYTFVASFRASTAGRSCQVALNWSGGGNAFSSVVTDSTTGWTQIAVTATAPAGTTFLEGELVVFGTASAGEVHYVDCAGLYPSPVVMPWQLGTGPGGGSVEPCLTTDAASQTHALVRTASEACTTADATSLQKAFVRAVSEACATADTAVKGAPILRTASESCLAADTTSRVIALPRTATETCITHDVATPTGGKTVAAMAAEAVATVDVGQVGSAQVTASESCACVDTATRVAAHADVASETCASVDSATFHAAHVGTAAEACTTVDSSHVSARAASVSEATVTVDSAARMASLAPVAAETCATADAVTQTHARNATAQEPCSTVDAAARLVALTHSAAEASVTVDSARRGLGAPRTASEACGSADSVARVVVVSRSATEANATVDATTRDPNLLRSVTEPLVTVDTASPATMPSPRSASEPNATIDVALANITIYYTIADEACATADDVGPVELSIVQCQATTWTRPAALVSVWIGEP